MAGETHTARRDDTRALVAPVPRTSVRPELPGEALESPRYLDCAGGQIYTVTHAAVGQRRGAVLLCGPFGVERERAYLTLVQWARVLAARGVEVMRFDYRGTGESSGVFEDMTIARWREDAAFCAARMVATQGGPLVLHGVRLGAVIAAELFASGVGDGLLLWAPPASAEALLHDTLRHNLIAQRMADPDGPHRTREQLVSALQAGELVDVDGYSWTRALWTDAQHHPLRVPAASEARPWHSMQAQRGAVAAPPANPTARPETVDADTFWKSSSRLLVPHSEGFFQASLRWLDENGPWPVGKS